MSQRYFHKCNITKLCEKYEACIYLNSIFLYVFVLCVSVGTCAMICLWGSEDKLLELVHFFDLGVQTRLPILGEAAWQARHLANPLSQILKDLIYQEIVLRMRAHPRDLADESGDVETLPLNPHPTVLTSYSSQTPLWERILAAGSGNSSIVPAPFLGTILRIRCKMAVVKNEQRKNSMLSLL